MHYRRYTLKTHRIIPSRYPSVSPFDWAQTPEEIEELAKLESLTNDRLNNDLGNLNLIPKEDWVIGEGATPLMAAFTHPGPSRFSDGKFGVYYAGDSLKTAVLETKFHRERFLSASNEPPSYIEMREYISHLTKELIDLHDKKFAKYLNPNIESYYDSQHFAQEMREKKEWGLLYPSVRAENGICFAIFRPSALTMPLQGCHLKYIWDGERITETNILASVKCLSFG